MLHFRRRNAAWLAVLGVMVAIALLSASTSANVQLTLAGLWAFSLIASFIGWGGEGRSLMSTLQRASRMQARVSPQAKEATERARRRGTYIDDNLMLIDVGLIALQSGREGTVMRRARSVSQDDDGVRPFITLKIAPEAADTNSRIRFEICDQSGQEQYIHEMRTYLHDGEMNILADHHLPLSTNNALTDSVSWGDWDLRVYMDGRLIGMHGFTMSPSRTRRPIADDAERYERLEADPDEDVIPLSLEELLRHDSGSQASHRR